MGVISPPFFVGVCDMKLIKHMLILITVLLASLSIFNIDLITYNKSIKDCDNDIKSVSISSQSNKNAAISASLLQEKVIISKFARQKYYVGCLLLFCILYVAYSISTLIYGKVLGWLF